MRRMDAANGKHFRDLYAGIRLCKLRIRVISLFVPLICDLGILYLRQGGSFRSNVMEKKTPRRHQRPGKLKVIYLNTRVDSHYANLNIYQDYLRARLYDLNRSTSRSLRNSIDNLKNRMRKVVELSSVDQSNDFRCTRPQYCYYYCT
jgi:hypothetical protein